MRDSSLRAAVGPDSGVIREAEERLGALYDEWQAFPPVVNSYRAWAAGRAPGDDGAQAFVRQTCQALLLRLVAYRFLGAGDGDGGGDERDLRDVVLGDWFAAAGWNSLLGEDFFSWPYFRLSMGIGDAAEGMAAARGLLLALRAFDFGDPPLGLVSDLLYADGDGLSEFPLNPDLGTIAPRCGSGGGLARAVRAAVDAGRGRGQDSLTALLGVSDRFLGMTADPLEATAAAVNFLLALGGLARQAHPPVVMPVYQADADRIPAAVGGGDGVSYAVDLLGVADPGRVVLPERVAGDPLYLDWLLSRLPNYQRGAVLRLRGQAEGTAVQEVLNAWYSYLVSPKVRTPIPEPLSAWDADVMVEAGRALITAYIRGSGAAPLHLARNAPAPMFAGRRDYPQVV